MKKLEAEMRKREKDEERRNKNKSKNQLKLKDVLTGNIPDDVIKEIKQPEKQI